MKKYDYWLTMLEAYGIGTASRKKLKQRFGNAQSIYTASDKEIRALPFLKQEAKEKLIRNKFSLDELEENHKKLYSKGIRLISEEDKEYPDRLRSIQSHPDVLFVKGRMPKENILTVSIVGSRHASAYGLKVTEYFTEELARRGAQIISGMAYGIDSCAHNTSLAVGADTFAVMGCGIDICYPAEKIELYEQIKISGGIISEYPPGTPPLPYRFPMRNRIIAGLSDVVIVVEARKKSGSLITANYALEQGKDVYVVPGRIDDINSAGCNALWFEGAIPALSIDTILEGSALKKALYIEETQSQKTTSDFTKDKKLGLASISDIVYSCLDLHPRGVEEIVKMTGKSPENVMSALVEMQLSGLAEEIYRGFYVRK